MTEPLRKSKEEVDSLAQALSVLAGTDVRDPYDRRKTFQNLGYAVDFYSSRTPRGYVPPSELLLRFLEMKPPEGEITIYWMGEHSYSKIDSWDRIRESFDEIVEDELDDIYVIDSTRSWVFYRSHEHLAAFKRFDK